MSTRYMRKVYGQSDQDLTKNRGDTDSEEEAPISTKPKSFNVFNLLNENSDENSDPEVAVEPANSESSEPEQTEAKPTKKKKKRNKKSQKIQKDVPVEVAKSESPDEIEEIVRTVNKLLGEPKPSTSKQVPKEKDWSDSCLTVQHKHLNPYNELKKIFGSKTVQAEQTRTRARGRSTNHFRKTWLVVPKDSWMPAGKVGLSMTIDHDMKAKDGIQYFKFEHSPAYKQIQMKFYHAIESFNPENLINITNQYGYHIDTLIQLSEYLKMSEDLPNSALFIERALYFLECAFHPLFNMTTANCRLDYAKQQNRALFITLFKHMMFVGNKACYRTSLELCKFLLSLDVENDPLATVLIIDFYAIRAKEYEWLVKFCDYWESKKNLSQLPNMAYSLALAHFYLGNDAESRELLQYALMMFPGVLVPLMDKCGIQMDSKVTSHNFFTLAARLTVPPALEKLQELFVARCYNSWKEPEVLEWLADQAHEVLNKIDSKATNDHVEMAQHRRRRYQGRLPRVIARHFILSDMPNITINTVMSQEERAMFAHDPLPPVASIDIYTNPFPRESQSVLSGFIARLHRGRANNEENFANANEDQNDN